MVYPSNLKGESIFPKMEQILSYHTWAVAHRDLAGVRLACASKPGTLAFGAEDPPTTMLASFVAEGAGERVMHLGGGIGLVPAAALVGGRARAVWNADRSWVGAEAARRTLAANREVAPTGQVNVAHAVGTEGFDSLPSMDTVTIRLPADTPTRDLLLRQAFIALRDGGRCAVAGATAEGIKSAARALEANFGPVTIRENHSRSRLVVASKSSSTPRSIIDAPPFHESEWFAQLHTTVKGTPFTMFTRPGVFSWNHVDEATALLAEHLNIASGASVLDLGCGAGLLGIVAAQQSGTGRVVLVDADADAVRGASRGIQSAGLQNAEARASDIGSAVRGEIFDVVVSNPPFHVGKATALSLPRAFIADAWIALRPGGQLLLVANRTLPYEAIIAEYFGRVRTLHDGRRFKVLSAVRA